MKKEADSIDPNDPHFDRYKSHGKQYIHDYIVVIDAGSKGSRAHLYRTKSPYQLVSGPKDQAPADSDDDKRDDDDDDAKKNNYIDIELMKRTKLKPGIHEFKDSLGDLHDKYFGKLLQKIESHIPKSQISRTPIFVHATGGVRLLPLDKQEQMMTSICEYLQKNHEFYLPDCPSHINVIDGELEGLYSWIGINYKEGVFNYDYDMNGSNYGVFDLGGASTQLAFAPSSESLSDGDREDLYRVQLHFNPNKNRQALTYDVFSQSYLGGINQVAVKYQDKIKASETKEDPCSSKDLSTADGVLIKGTSDFNKCLNNLNELLKDISADRYCENEDKSKCSTLTSYLPSKNYKFDNVENFIGVNEFHDSLEEFDSYKEFYRKTEQLCSSVNKKSKDDDEDDDCFKSTWIINILHESLGFPLHADDQATTVSEESINSINSHFQTLKKTSWTLGHAVLYQYDSIAQKQSLKPHQDPIRTGYFSPRSKVFIYGGEQDGVASRPPSKTPYEESIDKSDDDDDNGVWEHFQENNRLYGGLIILFMLLAILYLLFARRLGLTQKVNSVKQWIRGKISKSSVRFTKLTAFDNDLERGGDDIELGQFENSLADDHVGHVEDDLDGGRKDSFEI